MARILPALLVLFVATMTTSCDKDATADEETVLHGTWIKGSQAGDTLRFYERGGRHYMLSNQSFNPNMYAPVETEYRFRNGQLALKYAWGMTSQYQSISSFTWKVPTQEFEIQGMQLYMFMSSTLTKFTFHRVQ